MKNLLVVTLLVSLMFLVSCSSSKEIGKEVIVQQSGDSPVWIVTPTVEDDENIFVTGELTKAKDRSFGMKQAYSDGVMKFMNTMQNAVKTQSSLALRGSNIEEGDIGRFSEFAVGWISDTYQIAGVKNPESYWEKVEVNTNTGVDYYYNCYSLLSMSKNDYNKALSGAYDNMKKKAQEENNKKAEETAASLIDALNKGK
ncbi:MAG: hypothetical protein WAR79_11125 [Melioribacteraceae bacterium]